MRHVALMLLVVFVASPSQLLANHSAFTAKDLVHVCSYKETNDASEVLKSARCLSYLEGAIDVLRLTYAEKGAECLPKAYTLNTLKRDVLEIADHLEDEEDLTAGSFISMVMQLKYRCPLPVSPSF